MAIFTTGAVLDPEIPISVRGCRSSRVPSFKLTDAVPFPVRIKVPSYIGLEEAGNVAQCLPSTANWVSLDPVASPSGSSAASAAGGMTAAIDQIKKEVRVIYAELFRKERLRQDTRIVHPPSPNESARTEYTEVRSHEASTCHTKGVVESALYVQYLSYQMLYKSL